MAKRTIEEVATAWWVWLGEASAVRVATQHEALTLLEQQGRDVPHANSHGRFDSACAVFEITWNEASLPEWRRETPDGVHKSVFAPDVYFLCDGTPARVIAPLSPSRLAAYRRSWEGRADCPPWWTTSYDEAMADPAAVVLRGRRRPLEDRIRGHRIAAGVHVG